MGVLAGYCSIPDAELPVALHWTAHRHAVRSGSSDQRLLVPPVAPDPLWFMVPTNDAHEAAEAEYGGAEVRGEVFNLNKAFNALAYLLSAEFRESEEESGWANVPYDVDAFDPVVSAIFGSRSLSNEPWTRYSMAHDVRWISAHLSTRDWASEITPASVAAFRIGWSAETLLSDAAGMTEFYGRAAAAGRAVIVEIG